MQSFTDIFVQGLSLLTILSQLGILFLILLFVFRKLQPKDKSSKRLADLLANNYVALVFSITAGATAGSFAMSEIFGFLPCKLCWYQRVFMFPQFVVAAIALFTNDNGIKKYIVALSLIGAGIAVYHLLLQALPAVIQCGDELVSCEENPFVTFGYITIPVMSLTSFLLLISLSLFRNKK